MHKAQQKEMETTMMDTIHQPPILSELRAVCISGAVPIEVSQICRVCWFVYPVMVIFTGSTIMMYRVP